MSKKNNKQKHIPIDNNRIVKMQAKQEALTANHHAREAQEDFDYAGFLTWLLTTNALAPSYSEGGELSKGQIFLIGTTVFGLTYAMGQLAGWADNHDKKDYKAGWVNQEWEEQVDGSLSGDLNENGTLEDAISGTIDGRTNSTGAYQGGGTIDFNDTVRMNLVLDAVDSYIQEMSEDGFVDEQFNLELTNAFLYDGTISEGNISLSPTEDSYLEFNISAHLQDGKFNNTSVNADINNADVSLTFDDNSYINGSWKATTNDTYTEGSVTGNASIENMDMDITGALNGTMDIYFDNARLVSKLDNVTLEDAVLNATIEDARLENGRVNATFEDTSLTGDVNATLENTAITGSLTMSYNQLVDFFTNVTMKGTGNATVRFGNSTIHYGNGDVTITHENGTVEQFNGQFNLTNVDTNRDFTITFDNDVRLTGDVNGRLNNAVVNGFVNGTVNADLNGFVNGTVYNGNVYGWVNGTIEGNAQGYFDADIIDGHASGGGDMTFTDTYIQGNSWGNWTVDNATLEVHGGLSGSIDNAQVIGTVTGGIDGNVYGLARSDVLNLLLEGTADAKTLDAKLGGDITATLHRAAVNADLYAHLEGEGYLQGYANFFEQGTFDSEGVWTADVSLTSQGTYDGTGNVNADSTAYAEKKKAYGAYGALAGILLGTGTGVHLTSKKDRRRAREEAIERHNEVMEQVRMDEETAQGYKELLKKI